MSKLRGGIIGCGWVTQMHAAAFSQVPAVQIIGIADPNSDHLSALRSRFQLDSSSCYQDYRDLLAREDLDFVSISTNNHLHRQMVVAAAEAGKHILCEKAFANNLQDTDQMIEATENSGLKLAVYHEAAFYPENVLARKLLDEELGASPRFTWTDAYAISKWHMPPWKTDLLIAGGGIIMDEGVHLAHLNKFYFGEDPNRVSAFIDRMADEWAPYEDTASCMFEFQSGIAVSKMSFLPTIGREQTMNMPGQGIVTEKGSIEFVFQQGAEGPYSPVERVCLRTAKGLKEYAMPPCSYPLDKNINAFKDLIDDFVNSVIHDHTPKVTGRSARTAVEMVLASYESAALGRVVELPMTAASPLYGKGVLGIKELESQMNQRSKLRQRGMFGLSV